LKLAASNIAWSQNFDRQIYCLMHELGYTGLEIAPTRVFPNNPYDNLKAARQFNLTLKKQYNLQVVSLQSIWYGRTERLFRSIPDRTILLQYTKKAILFAEAIGAKNIVFGSPRNRRLDDDEASISAKEFFFDLGTFAYTHGTILSMEANPAIYETNYINTTEQALSFIEDVNNPGFKLNLDVGAMIENREDVFSLKNHFECINHVHISEPYLGIVRERALHKELASFLIDNSYTKYISLEAGKCNYFEIKNMLKYQKKVFFGNVK